MIAKYIELLRIDMVGLTFARDALVHIAESTIKQQTGARGLTAILVRKIILFLCTSTLNPCIARACLCKQIE